MAKQWKILARHRWVSRCTISESMKIEDDLYRRFTATIDGWRNWHIWQGHIGIEATPPMSMNDLCQMIIKKVSAIRDRIRSNDESVFEEPQAW